MAANKTAEILQQQIDKLNQEQTETKWNEKDKKLFEKFLGLVHDDPFRIFYADGGEVHRILELVYPESVKGRIQELFRIKYVYDGFLKYGEIVKPQIEIERPNLETLIKDISDHYLEVYRKQKKVKENTIKQCRTILEKSNKQNYITMDDCALLLDLAENSRRTIDERILLLTEILENNNSAIQEMLKMKITKKSVKSTKKKEVEEPEAIMMEEDDDIDDATVSMIEPSNTSEDMDMEVPEAIIPTVEEDVVEPLEIIPEIEEEDSIEAEEDLIEELEEEVEEDDDDIDLPAEQYEEKKEEDEIDELDSMENNDIDEESYITQYLHALEEIDPTDIPAIHYALPKNYMPNFNEIMTSLIETLKKQITEIKKEEQNSEAKKVRALREELGRAQQLLKAMVNYLEKQEKNNSEIKEKIVEGEEIQLLFLEAENGESLIERDFKKQLDESQYGIAMELFETLERFSEPAYRAKAKPSVIAGIFELTEAGVHIFFEPFAENTYIVIAILAEKNGYSSWVEDKLRLRHCLFQKQEKGMQRRWNQHGTRNTMLLGSETAYLEMQDLAEKR